MKVNKDKCHELHVRAAIIRPTRPHLVYMDNEESFTEKNENSENKI